MPDNPPQWTPPPSPWPTPPAYGPPPRPTEGLAIASLVLGVASFALCGIGAITATAGLALGIAAHRKIAASHGQLAGRELAIAGIATSAVALGITLLVILFYTFLFLVLASSGEGDMLEALAAHASAAGPLGS
ncbi:MAG: DUF4190 domain-containing protein [Acidimicrobiales bacterium]